MFRLVKEAERNRQALAKNPRLPSTPKELWSHRAEKREAGGPARRGPSVGCRLVDPEHEDQHDGDV